MEKDDSDKTSEFNGNKPSSKTIECLASTADLLRPQKKSKVEDLSTITLGYITNKRPNKTGERQVLRVLFDSGCGATLISKKLEEI